MIRGVPYDHQLEYIESTGSQYIDTGIVQADNLEVTITYQPVLTSGTVTWGTYFGCGYSDNSGYNILGRHYNTDATDFNPWFTNSSYGECRVPASTSAMNTMTVKSGRCIKDGVNYTISSVSGRMRRYTMYLFSANYSNTSWRSQPCRIARFSVSTSAGIKIADYIPVSVNGVAKMYDRVTRTFPKHYGTFVAGPVVSTPIMGVHIYQQVCTAADYIQDGLVAMIDGIENAGWGRHSENSYPVNLVDGSAISVNGGVSIGRDYFMFDAGQWGYFTCEQFASAIEQKKFTVEIVAKNNRASNAGVISVGSRGVWMYSDSSHNLQTLNILSSSYIPSPQINFRSDSYWRAVIQGGEQPTIDVNGTVVNAQYGSQTSVSSPVVYIGSLTGNPSLSNGKMWTRSLRIYSKLLTEGEKNHNKNVDMNRRFLDDDAE